MKVLIVSHNAIGASTNLGITLTNVFRDFGAENVAQFYVRNEEPTNKNICENYFRITDKEAMIGIFSGKNLGRAYGKEDIFDESNTPPHKDGVIEKVRMLHRTSIMDMGRELYWSLCPWFNSRLDTWLRAFDPDIIFFAAGDYSFSFKIALRIATRLNKPLVVACYDDFFFYMKDERTLMGRIYHRMYMRTVRKTMSYASKIITICEKMAEDYKQLFDKECFVLYTPAVQKDIALSDDGNVMAYFGTLGLGRDDQLVDIGRAVSNTARVTHVDHIDVYTTEKRAEALAKMTIENGIVLHKAVPFDEMLEIYKKAVALIHTESFDQKIRKRIRYSISTKVPEALSYGPCLFAYGPAEAASISYLKEKRAAYVITERKELEQGIIEMLTNSEGRKQVIKKAREVAKENHSSNVNSDKIRACFESAIHDFNEQAGGGK